MQSNLKNILSSVSNITGMDYAIFNTNSELVSSTEEYSRQKGKKVHTASLDEVLSRGNIVVNKPGLMDSCRGCRFVNNCPSTIEILSCIKLNGSIIGVISLTSFSERGHEVINKNIHGYINILEATCELITMFAYNEGFKKDSFVLQEALSLMTQENEYTYLVINKDGFLIHWEREFEDLFNYCDLYSQTIQQIFPENIVNWIFSNHASSQKSLYLDEIHRKLIIHPLKINQGISGYLLKLEKDKTVETDPEAEKYLNSIVSSNGIIQGIKETIVRISESSSSILITGQTGTGKEMIAKAIHFQSNRANNPFVAINCANIPESLFESELFGYEEGAFTGASKGGKLGLFEMANNGTIFLDEIGELTMFQQAKLLRVLQEGSIQRIGGSMIIPLDLRVIAATNRNLEQMIEDGQFRSDLYYRINVIPIKLPNLINRIEDIPLLTKHFIEKYNKRLNRRITSISKEASTLLMNYQWPGNIRELENAIEYAVNMANLNTIQTYDLPPKVQDSKGSTKDNRAILEHKEIDFISNLLDTYGWDTRGKQIVADQLGVSLRTLYRKLERMKA